MNNVLTIAGRQFRSYFNSPTAYIVITLIMLILGGVFWLPFFQIGRASVRDMFVLLNYLLLMGLPAVTMGLLADERRSGTLELLATMPVRESEIVLGKFLGALGLLSVLLLVTLPYPLSVSYLGPLDPGPVVAAYIGTILQGSAIIAIGLAASSMTSISLVSFFATAAICLFIGFVLPWAKIFFEPGDIVNFIDAATFQTHFESMSRGVLDTRDILYYVAIAGFSLLVAFSALENRRWS